MEEKISIVVPIYNVGKYLDRCINSIINQTYKNLEIILIDDGSSDNSKKICEKYKKRDSRIIFISKENTGVSDTRNVGIEIASGKYIGFVDSDDFIEDSMFQELKENMDKYNADISICSWVERKNKNHEKIQIMNSSECLKNILGYTGYQGYLWNKLYKKEFIEKYNIKLDKKVFVCEDLLFNCQYIEHIKKAVYTTKGLYNYIMRKGSALNNGVDYKYLTFLDAYDKMSEIYEKESTKIYDYFKAYYVLASINAKSKMFLNKAENIEIIKKCDKNIDRYLKQVLKSKQIRYKIKIKIFIYFYFYDIVNILKVILKKK